MTEYGDRYYTFRKGFQRVTDSVNRIPDRVPIYAQICELIPGVMNATADTIYRDPELLAIGTFTICEKYGIDVPVVDLDTYMP